MKQELIIKARFSVDSETSLSFSYGSTVFLFNFFSILITYLKLHSAAIFHNVKFNIMINWDKHWCPFIQMVVVMEFSLMEEGA